MLWSNGTDTCRFSRITFEGNNSNVIGVANMWNMNTPGSFRRLPSSGNTFSDDVFKDMAIGIALGKYDLPDGLRVRATTPCT